MWLNRTNSGPDLLQLLEGNWWPVAIGLCCLIVLIWLVVRLIARVNEDTDPAAADREMLMAITELHREGDLSQDEFRSIKGQLVRRLRPSAEEARTGAEVESDSAAVAEGEADSSPVGPTQSAPADGRAETEAIGGGADDKHRRTDCDPPENPTGL